jgi:uncharacterized membrane protein YtjA (UPF0391 family)
MLYRLTAPAARNRQDSPEARPSTEETEMLYYAGVFFVIALIAAILGFGGIAAGAAGIAKILFFVFLMLALVAVLSGLFRRA